MLVFDEMKTGFRLRPGGYQEYGSFEPDLAAFGKAMANGFPIAAVVGRAAVMEAAADTWISSTLAGEATALAAIARRARVARQDRRVRHALAHRRGDDRAPCGARSPPAARKA